MTGDPLRGSAPKGHDRRRRSSRSSSNLSGSADRGRPEYSLAPYPAPAALVEHRPANRQATLSLKGDATGALRMGRTQSTERCARTSIGSPTSPKRVHSTLQSSPAAHDEPCGAKRFCNFLSCGYPFDATPNILSALRGAWNLHHATRSSCCRVFGLSSCSSSRFIPDSSGHAFIQSWRELVTIGVREEERGIR
jgi:hypothetical protein